MRFGSVVRSGISAALVLGIAGSVEGCRPDAAVRKAEVIGQGTKIEKQPEGPGPEVNAPPSGPTGAIGGSVFFTGKAPTLTIDTTMDPVCSMDGGSGRLPVEQYVVKNGKLANVFLYIKSGPPEAMHAGPLTMQPVVMDQRHCQYVPHVVGVMVGGSVEFRNSDRTMHNVHTMETSVGNEPIDVSLGPLGAPVKKEFKKAELMIPVRCNNHPWMNAFINVSATPYFAVSDADGHFEISGLPPGSYLLGAVQEKAGEKDVQVTVEANQVSKAEFSFSAGK